MTPLHLIVYKANHKYFVYTAPSGSCSNLPPSCGQRLARFWEAYNALILKARQSQNHCPFPEPEPDPACASRAADSVREAKVSQS